MVSSATSHGEIHTKYQAIILLVLESGAVITLAKTVEFVLFKLEPIDPASGNHALYIVFDMMPQIMVRGSPLNFFFARGLDIVCAKGDRPYRHCDCGTLEEKL